MTELTRRAGMRVGEFIAALPIGKSAFFELPTDQRPRSVRLGRARIILESPREFLDRIEESQRESRGLFELTDRRQDGNLRVVASFDDPFAANAALVALRAAGAATAELRVVPAADPLREPAP